MNFKLFIKDHIYYLILIGLIISSCTSTKNSLMKTTDFDEISSKAYKYVQNNENQKAKDLLLDAMSKYKPVRSPFVENGTLVYYSTNSAETMAAMLLSAAHFNIIKDKGLSAAKSEEDSLLFELYEKTPWNNSIAIRPSYPMLYFIMGSIYNTEKKYKEAIKYLDTATYIYKCYGIAWAEKMYSYISSGDFKKAKEIGEYALKIHNMFLDESGTAAIQRKLGWIAVEENELDKAEEYYKKSLKNEENEGVHKELEYIEKAKKKFK
ncbi:MAG: MalT-like region [Bacteroidota bacterium]|nr:MalT-like region [Bacteroidota bacterium]